MEGSWAGRTKGFGLGVGKQVLRKRGCDLGQGTEKAEEFWRTSLGVQGTLVGQTLYLPPSTLYSPPVLNSLQGANTGLIYPALSLQYLPTQNYFQPSSIFLLRY